MMCEMNHNIWMCLQCGFLGCGRKQWDGSGGNNHAIQHYTETGHGVNLKLATLSTELDKTSMYCYKCDDDVKFNNIKQYLKTHFNIDLHKFNKTEKSVVEMNIDANMKLELSKQIESEMNIEQIRRVGIENLGNTCYANSVWQIVNHMGLFTEFINK